MIQAGGLVLARLITVVSLTLPDPARSADGSEPAPVPDRQAVELLSHDLSIELIPDRHLLLATDRAVLKLLTPGIEQIVWSLNAALHVTRIDERTGDVGRPLAFTLRSGPDPALQSVAVRFDRRPKQGETLTLEWRYEGAIDDPPREPRQLRFVTPSETGGHIGSEGVYLSGETRWYPDLPGALPTFRVRVSTPEGWEAVTHGTQVDRQVSRFSESPTVIAEWEVSVRTEALTLVANHFIRDHKTWRDPAGRRVEVATYLLPENAALSGEYLEASIRYLEAYTKLLGPYPFPKFAVVENFFASGLGMPSFTLLGSGVVKRHYVQPYALGHEIVHSWIGNWVLNDPAQGNWVEGLTTYLANYYYDELASRAEEAREHRRMLLLGYAVYVRPEEDYPVGQFRQKQNQKDNAIGYQKAAMVFHMLRREIGEQAFWDGLRLLVRERGGAYAAWSDLERVFARSAGRDLRGFFAQWVERAGAPGLRLVDARYRPDDGPAIRLQLRQGQGSADGAYRLRLPLVVMLVGGQVYRTVLEMAALEQTFTIPIPARPVSLQVDPEFETFRRLERAQLPPMLNLFVTDLERAVMLPAGGSGKDLEPYQELAARLTTRSLESPAQRPAVILKDAAGEAVPPAGSVLILGGPGLNHAATWALRGCGETVQIERDRITIAGQVYEDRALALLLSCRRPDQPGSVVTLFYGMTSETAAKAARLLFFYGWQSYLVFRDGAVIARGDWEPLHEELGVRFEAG